MSRTLKVAYLSICVLGLAPMLTAQDLWPPANLQAQAVQHDGQVDVELEWDAPQDPEAAEIIYDDGILSNAFYFYDIFENGFAHGSRFDVSGDFSLTAATVKNH